MEAKADGEQGSEHLSARATGGAIRRAHPPSRVTPRLPCLRITVGGIADEACLSLLEPELDLAGRTVAVLGELQVDDLALLLLVVLTAFLVAPQEHDEVGVLLDRARLPEVRQPGLLRLAHLGLARQLR